MSHSVHIADVTFGIGVDVDAFMRRILDGLPKMGSVDAQMVMKDLYEHEFGIYRHLDSQGHGRPLASVALHPAENINDGSLLEETIKQYVKHGIYDAFHMNLTEFLELPMDIASMLFDIAEQQANVKANVLSDIEKTLK